MLVVFRGILGRFGVGCGVFVACCSGLWCFGCFVFFGLFGVLCGLVWSFVVFYGCFVVLCGVLWLF